MRLIDADTLKDALNTDVQTVMFSWNTDLLQLLMIEIDESPTIDAELVRHGRWETDREDIEWGNSLKRKHCTNCGARPHFDKEKREFVLTNYCPNCGAKMDGGKK